MFTALFCVAGLTLAQTESHYARPDRLIEAAELAKAAGKDTRLVVLDARTKDKFSAGHIRDAVWVDVEAWSKSFSANQDADAWEKKIRAMGIGNKSKVVVYDDGKAKDSARVWFILTYWGAADVRLLNGGWSAWKGDVGTTPSAAHASDFSVSKARQNRLAAQNTVTAALQKKSLILDVRSEGEYCGDDKLKNKRGGHIPGAVHLEWTEVLDPKTNRFKSPEALAKLFKDAGVDLKKSTITHCQSGGRASVMAFALELMGADDVSNYYRGWSEWGNSEAPIESAPRKNKK